MQPELSAKASEIVACTRALLAVGGYHSFSYADISAAVHISKPSIHHHFPSKAALVRTMVALYREDARNGLAAVQQHLAAPLEQLKAYTGYWERCLQERDSSFCVCAMLAAELPTLPPEVADEVRGHFADLTAWLASRLELGAALGQVTLRGSPRAEASAFLAVVHGAMLAARAEDNPGVFKDILQPVLQRLAPEA